MTDNILLHRKELIILAAIEVINEFGVLGFSTKEVSKRVGISEPAIFKHFKTKSELLHAVLELFSHYDLDVIHSIRAKKLKAIESLHQFINTYATYYENYPAITELTQSFEDFRRDPNFTDKIQEILQTRKSFLIELIEQGMSSGELRADINSEYLAVTILGMEREWCLSWRFSGHIYSLKEKITSTLNLLMQLSKR